MSERYPKISVLMTLYNRAALVVPAIESFLKQDYPNAELLICDDRSTDNSFEVVQAYAEKHNNVRVIQNDVNKGFIRTINQLFRMADGAFVCILDSDDFISPNKLSHQLSVLKEYSSDAVISEFIHVYSDGSQEPQAVRSDKVRKIQPWTDDVYWPSGSLFMRREVLQVIPGYHEYFADSFCADIYFINAIAEKFKLVYDPTHLYYYRLTAGSMTQAFDLYKYSKWEVAAELIRQRKKTGTDDLELGKMEQVEALRQKIVTDRKWLSRIHRMYAARDVDELRLKNGFFKVMAAIRYNPASRANFRTLFYWIRKVIKPA